MAGKGFIKLDRAILDWRWYKNPNTFKLFVHLLLKANIKENDFEGAIIPRGALATSYSTLSAETGLTLKAVRIALGHLKKTGEVAVKRHSRFQVISILNYDLYQGQGAIKGQSQGNHGAIMGQQLKNNKECEERKEGERSSHPMPAALSEEGEDDGWVTFKPGKENK